VALPTLEKEKTMAGCLNPYALPRHIAEPRKNLIGLSSILALLAVLSIGASCAGPESSLSIFAAAGAKSPLDEICAQFTRQYGTQIEANYGGGGDVLSKMILSKSGDIFVAPEQDFMDTAAKESAIDAGTIKSLAYMIPVMAVPKGNPQNITTLADLARLGIRVVIARPETTLLGKYAPQIFWKAGLANAIAKNIVTTVSDCQSMLTVLVMGQVDAAITWNFYGTSAADKIDIIWLSPEQLTGVGQVLAAVSSYSQNPSSARELIAFMASSDSKIVFEQYGYITDAEEVSQYWH
jgi:molybdate transport system substrate-binding protein